MNTTTDNNDWYRIQNIDDLDSPALLVYPQRVQQNIATAISMAQDKDKLRPHVKTNKMAEVCRMMLDAGISAFKCATIAEAEMLALQKAPDVLLAYQPVGPKMKRLVSLATKYPGTQFSCLVDNATTAEALSRLCQEYHIVLPVYIDVNIGMNRTGIRTEHVMALLATVKVLEGIRVVGLHGYDGHIRDSDLSIRQAKADLSFAMLEGIQQQAAAHLNLDLVIVMGGTPTFPTHAQRPGVVCSPGTFVFWDWGYAHLLPDEPFVYAALVITRVISVIDEQTVCVDLGHKSIAAENPFPRVHFLNAPEAVALSQSEEHLVLQLPLPNQCKVGDVLYGVPVHICPTVALYDKAFVVENHTVNKSWSVIARNRSIYH